MKSEMLNKKMIENLPNLQQKYDDEVSWQEGDSTGSHTVFGDVFTPYLVACILQDDKEKLAYIFNFLESLLCINDEYINEVIALSVFESTTYLFSERTDLKNL